MSLIHTTVEGRQIQFAIPLFIPDGYTTTLGIF